MQKRLFCVFMAAACLLAFLAGCADHTLDLSDFADRAPQSDSGAPLHSARPQATTIDVAYNSSDALTPYEAYSAMNQSVLSLIYDPLVKLDQEYQRQLVLASDVVNEGTACTVTLRNGVVFSDGSPLTAQDVVYSARLAISAQNSYQGLLRNVEQVTAQGDDQVVFTLARADWLFPNLLTFPIVKQNSPSVGSGRYRLQENPDGLCLVQNSNWYKDEKSSVKTIHLVDQLDKDTLIYSLKLGTINYAYFDFTGTDAMALGINTREVPLNQMVYLGINRTRRMLSDSRMRQALSLALDRQNLAEISYANRAMACSAPFDPRAVELFPEPHQPTVQNIDAAQALLEELGYTQKDSEGYYVTAQGGRVRLKLLVNSDNESRVQLAGEIQKDLALLGLELTVEARPWEEYQQALGLWEFDLYLGETKLWENWDLAFLLSPEGSLGYGAVEDQTLLEAYQAFRSGASDAGAFCESFAASPPFLPLMFRSGEVCFSRDTYLELQPTEQDIFFGIENC